MTDALLSALTTASDDDERAWAFLEASLQGLDEGLRDFLFIAAIPHRFDATFLSALGAGSLDDAAQKLRRILELGFASSGRRGGYRMPAETRKPLLGHLRKNDPNRFLKLNDRAATYLASLERDDASRYAEFVYHAALNPSRGSSPGGVLHLVRETFPAWGGAPDFATTAAETIPTVLAEHIEAGRLVGPVPRKMELWQAMLNSNRSEARIALAFEGTGALCAYHAGVYEALHDAGIEPNWIAGESLGAMVGAVIAGNAPDRRMDALKAVWGTFAQPFWPSRDFFFWPMMSDWLAVTYGVPGLYQPSLKSVLPGATAFYDLSPARATLERYVDFDRLNSGEIRYAAGAVNVASGNFTYFDNAHMRIGPEHVLASMALPPGFPAVEINGRSYWDATLVSSTALQHVLNSIGDHAVVVFQPYLFAVSDRLPQSLNEVNEKQRAISFTSRARLIAAFYGNTQWMRRKLRHALERIPESERTQEDSELLDNLVSQPRVSLVNLVYRRQAEDGASAPHNFAQDAITEHWTRGRLDTERALGRDVLSPRSDGEGGITIYDADMRRGPDEQ
jgi:NTE family protein